MQFILLTLAAISIYSLTKASSPFWPEPSSYSVGTTQIVIDASFQIIPTSAIQVFIFHLHDVY